MRRNSAFDKRFTAKTARMNLISTATSIREIIIKDALKSFFGYIRHLFSYHLVPMLFAVCLVIGFNLDKSLA